MHASRFSSPMASFVVKTGVSTQQEVEGLYQQASAEMMSDTYCVVWFYLTVLGHKPYGAVHTAASLYFTLVVLVLSSAIKPMYPWL
jgi:hypothetical protein